MEKVSTPETSEKFRGATSQKKNRLHTRRRDILKSHKDRKILTQNSS
jgi:hypothetical protein